MTEYVFQDSNKRIEHAINRIRVNLKTGGYDVIQAWAKDIEDIARAAERKQRLPTPSQEPGNNER